MPPPLVFTLQSLQEDDEGGHGEHRPAQGCQQQVRPELVGANVNHKLKQSVRHETVRMGLRAIAWALMMATLPVVINLVTIGNRCKPRQVFSVRMTHSKMAMGPTASPF